ncbi:MAG: MarR family transcriptional regulator [Oligoflexia bacterium]|nr:MarR family transcriptional regulator [Oligoflexia bacterium]
MKPKFLEVRFQSFDEFKKEVKSALAKRTPSTQPSNTIMFDSVASFRHFMTIQKIELLTAISTRRPMSIYELAKMVDRDFAAVLRDCTGLEQTGFITLKESKDRKKTKIPLLRFDYVGLVIYLPKSPYQIQFDVAA